MSSTELGINAASGLPKINHDMFPRKSISKLYESRYDEVVYDPTKDDFVSDRLTNVRENWRQEEPEPVVVFTTGVFDLLHHDHKGYLLHTKLTGLPTLYERIAGELRADEWSELDKDEQVAFAEEALEFDYIKLIVSVDGDNSVSVRKGGMEKGDSPRPITSWETRARSVADLTVPIKSSPGWLHRPLADAVTMHGPYDFPPNSRHNDVQKLAANLQPDVWAVFEESKDILSTAPYNQALGKIALKCIDLKEGPNYFADAFIGRFSTSAILKRARGEL